MRWVERRCRRSTHPDEPLLPPDAERALAAGAAHRVRRAFSSMRLRQPGHTAYLSPHRAGRLLASCGRATIVQCWGGAVTIFRDVRGTGIRSRLTSSLASADVKSATRYHAPRRTRQFTSTCNRAHCGSAGAPSCGNAIGNMVKLCGSNGRVAWSQHGRFVLAALRGRGREPLARTDGTPD